MYDTHSLRGVYLVLSELLTSLTGAGLNRQNVVPHGLGQRTALTGHDIITDLGFKGGGAVHGEVPVALHVTLVLVDKAQVVPADNDRTLHLGRVHSTTEQTATDGHIAGERALLVNIPSLNRGLRSLESQTDVLPVAGVTRLVNTLFRGGTGVLVHTSLLLVRTLHLDRHIDCAGLEVGGLSSNHLCFYLNQKKGSTIKCPAS